MMKPAPFPCRQFRLCLCVSTSAVFTFYFLIMDRASRRDVGTFQVVQNTSVNSKPKITTADDHGTKLVLIWSPLFSGWNFLEEGKSSFRNCPESRCEVASDRNRLEESDAILFHVRTMSLTDLPLTRRPRQKWTFFSLEAPPYSHFYGFSFMSNMFNWTMTYRSDSDVVIRYGRILKTDRRNILPNTDRNRSYEIGSDLYSEWKNKTRMAVWMVSHCSTSGNREGFVERLREYVDVTTFGECGVAVCQFNKTEECLENFSKKFHFYLSFENAICDDYVTEKFYRVVNVHMIPVVFGGGAYSSIAPPNSFIDALDFESVEALSAHLHKVAADFSLFSSYFEWRRDGYEIEDVPNHCGLCAKLHSQSFLERTSYEDMAEWWVKKSHCRSWKDY